MTEILYRPATITDAPAIAPLVLLAADGLVDFLLADVMPETSSTDLLTSLIAREDGEASYRNIEVAVTDGTVVGIAQTYPAVNHQITAEMRELLPAERLNWLEDFFGSRVEDSWFLDTLAVAPSHQGLGVGSRLIDRVKQVAQTGHYPSVSLIAWADNHHAIRLYQRQGFQPVKAIHIEPHPELPHSQGAILMDCRLN